MNFGRDTNVQTITFHFSYIKSGASQVALVVKNPPANAGDIRDAGLIPRLERSPGEGNGNPLQYSCLENPMDRSLVGYSPWGRKDLDMTEQPSMHACKLTAASLSAAIHSAKQALILL